MTIATSAALKLNVLAQATGLPAWYTSAGVSQWTDLNAPHPAPITTSFSSAIINTMGLYVGSVFTPGTWICTFGGGHAASDNNAVYAYGPLEEAVPIWRQISQIVAVPQGTDSFNGYPPSPHSYDAMNYLPVRNWMTTGIAAGGFQGGSGTGNTNHWVFDFNVPNPMVANPWVRTANNVGTNEESVSCYDSVVDRVFMLRLTTNMGQFVPGTSPSAGVWSQYVGGTGLLPIASKAAFHPSRLMVVSLLAYATTQNTALGVINLNTGVVTLVTPSGTGPLITTNNHHTAIDWVPSKNKFAMVADFGNTKTVFWITTGADPLTLTGWSWSSETPAGGVTPFQPQPSGQGIYGRFRAVDNGAGLRGLVLINSDASAARLYFWRLP